MIWLYFYTQDCYFGPPRPIGKCRAADKDTFNDKPSWCPLMLETDVKEE